VAGGLQPRGPNRIGNVDEYNWDCAGRLQQLSEAKDVLASMIVDLAADGVRQNLERRALASSSERNVKR
jgi:hypothetical protein